MSSFDSSCKLQASAHGSESRDSDLPPFSPQLPKGLVAMLALNGIFVLVTKHGLEYPHFYRRLYGLLKVRTFLPFF